MHSWDKMFTITNMTLTGIPFPDELIKIDEHMILKRMENKPEKCVAHLLVETTEGEEIFLSEDNKRAEERILDFVSIYSLKTYHKPRIEDSGSSSIREIGELGNSSPLYARGTVIYKEEKKKELAEKEKTRLTEAIKFFRIHEEKIINNSWLRNALRYYYFATQDERLEDKIINFFIAMESLFFGKIDPHMELRYKLSLRSSILISIMLDSEATGVFEEIKRLYGIRCDVVHGESAKVFQDDTRTLKKYTAKAIEGFIILLQEKSKKEILELLDNCLVDKDFFEKIKLKFLHANRLLKKV